MATERIVTRIATRIAPRYRSTIATRYAASLDHTRLDQTRLKKNVTSSYNVVG